MNLSVYFVTPHNPDDSLVLAALKGGASSFSCATRLRLMTF